MNLMTPLNGVSLNGASMNGAHGDAHPTPVHGVPVISDSPATWPPQPFDDVDQEKARLEAQLAAATARLAAARQRAVVRDAEVRAVLHAELLASKETLARMEREYEMAIAMVQQAATAEAERVLAAAREEIALRARQVPSTGASDAE